MNILKQVRNWAFPSEQRSSDSVTLTDPRLLEMLKLNSGEVRVSTETALSLSTLYRCVDVLSSSFACLPWDLIQTDGKMRQKALSHPVSFVKTRPHNLYSSFHWRKYMLASAILWGNGYARIIRNGVNRPTALKPYHPREVTVLVDAGKDNVFYQFPDVSQPLPASEVFHLKLFSTDGILGRSIVQMGAETLEMQMQGRRFTNSFYKNGTRLSGIIKAAKSMTKDALKRIRDTFFADHGGSSKAGGIAVLDEGMDFQQLGVPPGDAQLMELLNWTDEKICALVGVPQHMAGILSRSTNNNIEHQGIEFVVYSLQPHVVNFEQEADYKLLRTQEQGIFYFNLNMDGLLRGDTAARREFYRMMRNSGILNANEIRALEDMNPYEGGDTYLVQGAMVAIDPKTGKPEQPAKQLPTSGQPDKGEAPTEE